MAAPCSMGLAVGGGKVLSTMRGMPLSAPILAIASMSATPSPGLPTVSQKRALVLSVMARQSSEDRLDRRTHADAELGKDVVEWYRYRRRGCWRK